MIHASYAYIRDNLKSFSKSLLYNIDRRRMLQMTRILIVAELEHLCNYVCCEQFSIIENVISFIISIKKDASMTS